jgi:hypothetical protein
MKKVLVGQPDRLRENAALVKWVRGAVLVALKG